MPLFPRLSSAARPWLNAVSRAPVTPPHLTPIAIPAIVDADVIVPPTPTKQLLPLSETDGLTSGAVQPPGSTGENIAHPHPHVYEKRVAHDAADDSDSSFTNDEHLHDAVDVEDVEDEEQRLIRLGGTGIPIMPVSPPCMCSSWASFTVRCAGRSTEAAITPHRARACRA